MKKLRLVCSLCLLLVSLLAVGSYGIVLGAEGDTPQPELISAGEEGSIKLTPTYPSVEAIAGGTFEFQVELLYAGEDVRVFDLQATAPAGWDVYVTPRYEKEKKISSITLKPSFTTGETVLVTASAPFWPLPDPGDYKITVEAVSDTIKNSTELNAKVIAKYVLSTVSANERYNTTAEVGKDNYFSIKVLNYGSDAIEDIKFTPTKPDGWLVEFQPDKIDIIEAIDEQTVEINIQPPAKTVAGDYLINVRASGKQASADEMSIRVTVETPTIWGWVGVAIILVVVMGLIVIFMRFSRR
ncbi:NEW3 domain-containing protein [Chloroflexota bacterium]